MIVGRARDIAGSTGPGPNLIKSGMHCGNHIRMLAHAQIIVRTPDRHITFVIAVISGGREVASVSFKVSKDTIITFIMQLLERLGKKPS